MVQWASGLDCMVAAHSVMLFVAGAEPLPANTPISIATATGEYMHVDNDTSLAYAASGSGTSLQETFIAVDPTAPSSLSPVQPGQEAVLQSAQTGEWCRLVVIGAGPEQGMVCDQPSSSSTSVTAFVYTGSGLSVDGQALVSTGSGEPLVLANSTSAVVQPTSDDLTFSPTGGFTGCQ